MRGIDEAGQCRGRPHSHSSRDIPRKREVAKGTLVCLFCWGNQTQVLRSYLPPSSCLLTERRTRAACSPELPTKRKSNTSAKRL